jgi:uncharacterized Tic20 family protein
VSAALAKVRREELTTPAERRAAAAAHLSAAAVVLLLTAVAGGPAIWIGMTAFLGPLVVLLTIGRGAGFIRSHAVAALAFNISFAVYLAAILGGVQVTAGSPYTVQAIPFLLFVNMLLGFNWLVFTLIAVHRAGTGQLFTYPMTIRWRGRMSFPSAHRRA